MGGPFISRLPVIIPRRFQNSKFPLFIFWYFGLLLTSLPAQVILTEIMFDPDTLESHNEYVEIFNAGDSQILLENWKIGDAQELDALIDAGFGLTLNPRQFGVILDASYFGNSTTYDNRIPPAALIITIDDGSFGSYGWSNTVPEPVILVNAAGDTLQVYTYSINNLPGYSDEKKWLNQDNSQQNWSNSNIFRGTPGSQNSVSPLNVDISIDSAWVIPKLLLEELEFSLSARVINTGIDSIFNLIMNIFIDQNGNSEMDPNEILETDSVDLKLGHGDEVILQWTFAGWEQGQYRVGICGFIENDSCSVNNCLFLTVSVEPHYLSLIINEIMFQPMADRGEWIEVYNQSASAIDLQDWLFADLRDTILITHQTRWLEPFRFVVIGKDSSTISEYGISVEDLIVNRSFPTLNNDWDELKILSPSRRISDRVEYWQNWMRRETTVGISLERINPAISSALAENWAACVDATGATPARQNSIYLEKPADKSVISIQPNPFSPDGDGYEDHAIIGYSLPFPVGYITIDIFNIAGNRIRRLKDREPVGSTGNFIWDGTDTHGRTARIGIYILLIRIFQPEDQIFQEIKKRVVLTKR